jgi:sugar lactone lactonase YvrE
MNPRTALAVCVSILLPACGATQAPARAPSTGVREAANVPSPSAGAAPARRPESWSAPEVLVAASSFHGVHGVAIDKQGRLLAGSVVGHDMWEVDRETGAAKVFIAAPQGEADDIAVGPRGELAWTSYSQGIVRYRERDDAPIRELAKGLPGANAIAFNFKTGKLYMSQVFLGDALWELDVQGKKAPRLIAKELGGFNGFEVGPDGQLYGPLWFKGQVVKVDPRNGKITVISSDFKTPAAANLDGKGNLWVLDTKAGTLNKIELASGQKSEAAKLATALDNLAIAPEGTIYVSNMADNSIQVFDPAAGTLKTLTRGKLSSPAAMKLDGHDLLIADVFAFRAVDTAQGEVRDIYRAQDSKLEYPGAVGLGSKLIALSSWSTGTVQLLDRASKQDVEMLHGLKAPMDAIPLDDGALLIAEIATGSITRASGEHYAERVVVAKDLAGPTQMILGKDGALYVTEAAGRLTKIDLASGEKKMIAEGLALPEGLAETPWGTFIVAEAAAQRLTEIDPRDGQKRAVAESLPIGLAGLPGMPPPYLTTGVAVGEDGTVFVTADLNQSLLRIRPN